MLSCGQCGLQTTTGAKFCPECGAALRPAPARTQQARKSVTIVFSDLVGSTSLGEELDAESLRIVMDDYFRVMRTVLEEHGGVVEKFIGDAVMAVFGLPRMHEDDALRAVRAAVGMRDALAILNKELSSTHGVTLCTRTGVNTGVVVVGDASGGQRLATGDAVNVAARLEQAAPADGIVLGPDTFHLVKGYVDACSIGALSLKGKAEMIDAWRLVSLRRHNNRFGSTSVRPLIGRLAELAVIESRFADARHEGRVESVLVVAEPGVGKSRLVREVVERLGSVALVLSAACQPYGTTSFWPVADLLTSALDGGRQLDRAALTALAADAPAHEREAIAERVASILGFTTASFPLDESFWATARLLMSIARRRPLVLVVEDLHWAEATLLDLFEQLRHYPHPPGALILATARPELLDSPHYDDVPCLMQIVKLPALSALESDTLMDAVLDSSSLTEGTRALIHHAAEGNPLFLEQTLATWMEDGVLARSADGWTVTRPVRDIHLPASISAILSARVDRLTDDERLVLGAASVAGLSFDRLALRSMLVDLDSAALASSLQRLIGSGLLAPVTSDGMNTNDVCFVHASFRDVTSEMTLKSDRAAFHERFAAWVEDNPERSRGEGLMGYHLAEAYKYRAQLRQNDPHTRGLALRSARHLVSDCQRALRIGDRAGAEALTGRVVELLYACGPEICATDLPVMETTAKLLVTMGRWREAVDLLSPCVASGHGPLLRDLGVALCQLHRSRPRSREYREAQRLLEMAGAPPNRDTDALASLAGTWKGIDDVRAHALYRQCLDLDPADPYALGNVLEYEITAAQDLAIVESMRGQIIQAVQRCRSQADAGANLPWAFFDAGKFDLLLGEPYEAIAAYAKAVQLTTADHMLATSATSLQRLEAFGGKIPGSMWARRLLGIARAAWFPSADSLAGLGDATPLAEVDERTRVLMLAGGTDATAVPWFEHHRGTLMESFVDFTGVIISGGTDDGVAGLAGALGECYGEQITAIGYLPEQVPDSETADARYNHLVRTAETQFSIAESLQAWADLIASGTRPATVKLLAINGGTIAGAEYRVALALGCTVGVVVASGREADRLLEDLDWVAAPHLARVDLDRQAISDFLTAGR